MEQSVDAISENLKSLRESRGLSLDQLSELTGVSKSMLRQIETGKSSPTISTIWKIANGLHVSFTALLRKHEVEAEIHSFKEGSPLTAEDEHYRIFPMIPFDPQSPVETYYMEIDPGTTFHGEPHKGNVYEYLFVTKGEFEMILNGKPHKINTGEYIKFQADCKHSYKCTGEETATAILQISYLS